MDGSQLYLAAENRAAIEGHLHALGWLVPGESLRALDKAGEGNMNVTLRATTDRRTLILKQSRPYVAKYPQIPAPAQRIDLENRFYTEVARDGALAMRMPARVGFDAANRLLALEDVGDGGDMLHLYADTASQEPARGVMTALVYWLWRLHALAEVPAGDFANTDMRALNHAHIFVIPFQPDSGAGIAPGLETIATTFQQDDALKAAASALGDIYLGRAPHASRPCLLHGDYYPGSWLHNQRLGVVIIDPEFAFVGAPEFDVGVMLAHLTFAGYTQADLMGILRSYVTPPGFDYGLAMKFAAIESIRRLLGVAQLPLTAGTDQRLAWLHTARGMLLA